MKKSSKVIVGVIIAAIALFLIIRSIPNTEAEVGKYDTFAQCLRDSGARMFGAYWCQHCQNQKKMFGSSASKILYVECDPRGDNARPDLCQENNIQGYPTWVFSNGERIEGEAVFSELSFRTGCPLPQ
ncbi:MAG: hypothetical protein AABY05_01915 [Nanoarchaeota archaeon]